MAFKAKVSQGAIAKWLRRLIRNQFPFRGAGSSPAGVATTSVMLLLFAKPCISFTESKTRVLDHNSTVQYLFPFMTYPKTFPVVNTYNHYP